MDDFLIRLLYTLRHTLVSVSNEVQLDMVVQRGARELIMSAEARPPPRTKRVVTTRDFQRMDQLQDTLQQYLERNFPRTRATALDVVLAFARLARKCEIQDNKKYVSILVC